MTPPRRGDARNARHLQGVRRHDDAATVADAALVGPSVEPAAASHVRGATTPLGSAASTLIPCSPAGTSNTPSNGLGRVGRSFIEGIAGASLASLDVRSDDTVAAVATYRWLVPLWMRAGLQTPFWNGMRASPNCCQRPASNGAHPNTRCGDDTGAGHEVFGADADRLFARPRPTTAAHVGAAEFDDAFGAGSGMGEAAVAHEATAAFDRISVARRVTDAFSPPWTGRVDTQQSSWPPSHE